MRAILETGYEGYALRSSFRPGRTRASPCDTRPKPVMSRAPRRASGPSSSLSIRSKDWVQPHSGGLASFAMGGIVALACLIAFGKFTITTDLSANRSQQARSMTEGPSRMEPPTCPADSFHRKALSKPIVKFPKTHPTTPPTFRSETNKPRQPEPSASLVTDDTPQVKGEEETVKIADSAEQTPPPQPPSSQSEQQTLPYPENHSSSTAGNLCKNRPQGREIRRRHPF